MSSTTENDYQQAREYLRGLSITANSQASCLSAVPHSLEDARDLRCHFFGCLGYEKRVKVLNDPSHPIWNEMCEMERSDATASIETETAPSASSARYISALNLQAELKRIAVLRRTPALKESVRDLRNSIKLWVQSSETKKGIQEIHDRRVNTHTFGEKKPGCQGRIGSQSGDPATPCRGMSVSKVTARCQPTLLRPESEFPEREEILPEFSAKLREIVEAGRDKKCEPEPDLALDASEYDLERDIKARFIKLKRPRIVASSTNTSMMNVMIGEDEPIHDEVFKGTFPDQQVSVHWLLKNFRGVNKTDLRLEQNMCPEGLRYFHIPANNMSVRIAALCVPLLTRADVFFSKWVERAIATYCDETIENMGDDPKLGTRTKLVLNDWCWKGQEHGGGPDSVAHNRNMRPTCEKISTDQEDLYHNDDNTQKSLVLFMPFLHWETDRRRNHAANLIEHLTDEHDLEKRETAKMWKMRRQEDRKALPRTAMPAPTAPLQYQEPDYYVSRGESGNKLFCELSSMLWNTLYPGKSEEVPSGLAHILWVKVKNGEHQNVLLLALKKVVEETRPSNVSPVLRPLFLERKGNEYGFREWRDILWQLKAAGRGRRTPHALDDIFWQFIKTARKQADNEAETGGETSETPGSMRSRRIFQEPTKIFNGVETDEHGVLQPGTLLAQVLVKAARLYEQMTTYPDQQILEEYLFKDPPLHPRRTLDQAYFWRLRNTRLRDRDQVVYRHTNAVFAHRYQPHPRDGLENRGSKNPLVNHSLHTKQAGEELAWTRHGQYEERNGCDQCNEDIKKVSRAIMVDQLWLWVLDRNTILTCFSQRYGMSEKDPSGVHQAIRTRVKSRSNPDNHVHSIFDLALIILDECFDAFFNRTKTADARPQVLDVFAESIGHVTNRQAVAFQHLWSLSERQAGSEENVDPSILNALLNVSLEADLQREIRDIIDELDIVLHIVQQQQDMITRFKKFAEQIIVSDIEEMEVKIKKALQAEKVQVADNNKVSFFSAGATATKQSALEIMRQQKREFGAKAEVLLSEVEDRIKEIGGLKKTAESTAQNVNDLLGLKQQQAGIVQAYEAMKQGEETVRQGKAIMVFTVMTIIFLPLSFMTSVFGMNNIEESGSSDSSGGPVADEIVSFWPTTFKRQIVIMFTVSFGAVLVVLIPAFSPFIRAVVHSALSRSFTKAITWTKLYQTWLAIGWDSEEIRGKAKADVRKMKEGVKEQMSAKRLTQSQIWDGVRSANGGLLSKRRQVPSQTSKAHENPRITVNGAATRLPPDVEKGVYQE